MADKPREPQSYGSQADWQTGKTDQQVHDPKSTTPGVPEPDDTPTGGQISDYQLDENAQPAGVATGGSTPVQKVSTREGGAKRDSYFRRRDYE